MPRLTVVSNRLPLSLSRNERGGYDVARSSGGLVTAMEPLLSRQGGGWVGWPGLVSDEGHPSVLTSKLGAPGYELQPVLLDREVHEGFYAGFANSVLWPLFHGLSERCAFQSEFWDRYLRANAAFARAVRERSNPDGSDLIWIHDYHLIPAGEKLRDLGERGRLGFFLHIPFPNLQEYVKLPWRAQLLRALLAYDLIGLQTGRDVRHFLECVDRLMPDVEVVPDESLARIEVGGRTTRVGAFPIGTDFRAWEERAASRRTDALLSSLRQTIGPYQVLLGVDRLDYTKGLLERLEAYRLLLERHPELRERVLLLQLVVPSRETVPEYRALKKELDQLVGHIIGRYSTTRWSPIRYLYAAVSPDELAALYRLASTCVVTPICDGMNLVAKEYCATQLEGNGALVLSEMAGSAAQLADDAILVNPFDFQRTADAIHRAVTMDGASRRRRMRALRREVREADVFWWGEAFLETLARPQDPGEQLHDVEYLPTIEVPSSSLR